MMSMESFKKLILLYLLVFVGSKASAFYFMEVEKPIQAQIIIAETKDKKQADFRYLKVNNSADANCITYKKNEKKGPETITVFKTKNFMKSDITLLVLSEDDNQPDTIRAFETKNPLFVGGFCPHLDPKWAFKRTGKKRIEKKAEFPLQGNPISKP